MRCRSFTAIVLAVAMLVSFGLCNLSVAADTSTLVEQGAVNNSIDGVYVQLGTYNNNFGYTGQPYELFYCVDTFPYTYHNSDFYNSQIKGTSTYETYYEIFYEGEWRQFTITYETVTGNTAASAIVDNDGNPDNHPQYQQAAETFANIVFYAECTNTIRGNYDAFFGSRSSLKAFQFDSAGNYIGS